MRNRKTAVITGGSRGLGRALSLAFAREGYYVYATGRDPGGLTELRDGAKAADLDVVTVRSDISQPSDNAELAARIGGDGRRIDVLVHNASVLGPRVRLSEYPPDEFARVLAVNTYGPFDLTKRLLPYLGSGAAVQLITSGVGIVGKAGWGAYSISKFGLEGLGQILAEELAPRGIGVYVIDPGAMRTHMRARAFPAEDPARLVLPEDTTAGYLWLATHAPRDTGVRFKAQEFGAGWGPELLPFIGG